MQWHTPNILWLLWLLPPIAWLSYRAYRKRESSARLFATGQMRARLIPHVSATRTWAKTVLMLAGLATLIVAVARPKYGVYYEQVTQRGVDLFVLLDVSRSMLAQDIAPNRLERAKSDILDLLERIPTDRVGLVVFAGKAVPRVPLTNDHNFFRQMLRDVDTDSAPVGGSLIGDAIRMALGTMQRQADRDQVIVLITDGEDHNSFPLDAAQLAAERGVRIITVGLGDRNEGARIPESAARADHGYVKDKSGEEVWSKMDEELLKQIALQTSGAYVPARTMAYDLGQIYDDHLSGLTRGELRSEKRQRFREQFQWFACLGLVLLVSETLLGRTASTAAMLGLLLLSPAPIAKANDVVAQSRAGMKAFENGEFEKAAELFEQAAKSEPDDPRIVFNQACAVAKSDTPEKARDLFYRSALSRDVRLSADSHYNLGYLASEQAQQILGADPQAAKKEQRGQSIELVTQAMGHYRDALKSDPTHANSRHNLEMLRLWVKQMKALWEQQDRVQQQQDKDALQMLKEMDARQLAQRSILGDECRKPASPKRQEQIEQIHEQQRQLVDDVEPLKQKLIEQFATPAQQPNSTTSADPDQLAKAQQVLDEWTSSLRRTLVLAADRISDSGFTAARQAQRDAVNDINQLYVTIGPFSEILQTAISDQKSRNRVTTDLSTRADKGPDSDTTDTDELAWRQERIGSWAAALVAKAEHQLPGLEQSLEDATQHSPRNTDPNSDDDPLNTDPPDSNATAELTPVIESLRKAIELAPQVSDLSQSAAVDLRSDQFKTALPKQQQALKLLEQIAEGLPKNENQDSSQDPDQQQNNNQDNPNQDNQQGQQNSGNTDGQNDPQQNETNKDSSDENKSDQQGDSQQDQPKPSDGDEQTSRSKQNDDQQNDVDPNQKNASGDQDTEQKDSDQETLDEKNEQTPEDHENENGDPNQEDSQRAAVMTSARAESILQRVRDRERQHRQIQKQLRNLLQKRTRPERDW